MTILPDVLGPGLRVVFCGSAASTVAAARGAPYAGPGNRFWPTLFEIGLTPRRFAPEEFRESPAHALRTIRRVAMGTALAVTVEEDRWAKAKASIRGLLPRSGE